MSWPPIVARFSAQVWAVPAAGIGAMVPRQPWAGGERLGAVTNSPTAADQYEVRRLGPTDSAAGQEIADRAFSDLSGRLGMEWPELDEDQRIRRGQERIRHIVDTDPEGAWGAFHGDDLVGVALAIRRGDLWGLSLLVVDPPRQSSGVGRRLLDSALSYHRGCRGGLILSSADPRALRAYATSGFALHPTAHASGTLDRRRIPAGLRVDEGPVDLELVDEVDRRIRGASHRPDMAILVDAGGRFLKVSDREGRGYAVAGSGPRLLAATAPAVARRLLWTALALSAEGEISLVAHIDARQQWAFEVVLQARLSLMPQLGALFIRGEVGSLMPYLPSGAYL